MMPIIPRKKKSLESFKILKHYSVVATNMEANYTLPGKAKTKNWMEKLIEKNIYPADYMK